MPPHRTKFYCDCRKLCHGIPTLLNRNTYQNHKKHREPPPQFESRNILSGSSGSNRSLSEVTCLGPARNPNRLDRQIHSQADKNHMDLHLEQDNKKDIEGAMGDHSHEINGSADNNDGSQTHDYEEEDFRSDILGLSRDARSDVSASDGEDANATRLEDDLSNNQDEFLDDGAIGPTTAILISPPVPAPLTTTQAINAFFSEKPKVPDLKTAMDFVQHLSLARLETSGLTTCQINQLREPRPPPDISERSQSFFSVKQLLATINCSEKTYRLIAQNYNEQHLETPMLSLEDVKTTIPSWTGVYGIRINMCKNTCMAFTGPFKDLPSCSFCGSPQFLPQSSGRAHLEPVRQFYSIPLGPQIQALWKSPDMAKKMMYRRESTARLVDELCNNNGVIDVYEDFIHGSEYLQAVESGTIGTDDTVFIFGMDGAQLYRDKSSDCWLFIIVLLELSPQERYLKKHVMVTSCIPGPNKPQQFDSFMFPTFEHIAAVNNDGGLRIWNSITNQIFSSKLFCFLAVADGPASAYFTGLVGHHGAHPCRLFCGIKGRNKPRGSCYYPILLKPDGYTADGCDHDDIDIKQYRSSATQQYDLNLLFLLASENKTNYILRRKITGISKPPLILGLSTGTRLSISGSLCGEAMHATTLNLGELLLPLWRGSFTCDKTDNILLWDWALLRDAALWEDHGQAVESCRQYIPGSFDRAPRNIALKMNSGYKAKEWQNYLLGLAPALLLDILPEIYWKNFCSLVRAIQICMQHSIQRDDLIYAQGLLDNFIIEFEDIYIQRRTDRIHFGRPCLHAIWHLGLEATRLAPSGLFASWFVERTIGNLGQEIHSDSNPFSNLSERCLLRCQTIALKAMYPTLDKDPRSLPDSAISLGSNFILLHPRDRYPRIVEEQYHNLINAHLALYGMGCIPGTRTHLKIVRWGRVLLPNGQISRSLWKESQRRTPGRCSRNIKYYDDDNDARFAEVIFYFMIELTDKKIGFALIRNYINNDSVLYRESCGTVISVEQGDIFNIIPIYSIQSVVAVNPWDRHQPGSFFVWEKPGLPLSMLQPPDYEED